MKYTKAEMFADWIETANTIAADLRRLSAEVDEQARLNGMGAECELKLMAERDELRQKLALSEESDAENLRLYRAVRDQRDALRAEIERMRAAPAPVAQGEPVALPADFLEWARNLLVRERARLDGFVAIGNELHRAATYDRWIAALNATPTRACHSDAPKHRAVALADDLDEWALMETEQGKVLRTIPALEAEIERLRAAPDPVAQPVAWWIPKAEQFCLAKQDGSRPFAKAWEPLYAAPAPVAQPTMPEGWVPLTLEWDPGYPEDVAYGPQRMMDRLKKWLDKHFANKINADKLQADAARLDWLDLQAQTFGNPENECPDGLRWVVEGDVYNLRHAIDANMAEAARRARAAIEATGQEGGAA